MIKYLINHAIFHNAISQPMLFLTRYETDMKYSIKNLRPKFLPVKLKFNTHFFAETKKIEVNIVWNFRYIYKERLLRY